MLLRLTIWQVCHRNSESSHKVSQIRKISLWTYFIFVWTFTESDNSYSVSCGIPILRGKSPARLNSNSSQSCIGLSLSIFIWSQSFRGPNMSITTAQTAVFAGMAVWCFSVLLPTGLCLSVEALAPPVKQTASFKIKNAKCHLHPKLPGRTEDRGRTLGQGQSLTGYVSLQMRCLFIYFNI